MSGLLSSFANVAKEQDKKKQEGEKDQKMIVEVTKPKKEKTEKKNNEQKGIRHKGVKKEHEQKHNEEINTTQEKVSPKNSVIDSFFNKEEKTSKKLVGIYFEQNVIDSLDDLVDKIEKSNKNIRGVKSELINDIVKEALRNEGLLK